MVEKEENVGNTLVLGEFGDSMEIRWDEQQNVSR